MRDSRRWPSGGRFIEMGVADIRSAESVAAVRPDIAYRPFNLAPALEAGESFVGEILSVLLDQFRSGALKPLPREVFSMEKARDAFRYMAQARHIGRVIICTASAHHGIRSDGAYLVTGGLSGLGLTVAEWLAKQGAAQIIVMGRSGASAEAAEILARMRDAGATVSVCRGDVAKEQDVRDALNEAKSFPLRGIFHCAGVFDDGAVLQQDWERFGRVLSPKILGAVNLHRLTMDAPLDQFILFSSMASVFGSQGQTNYAAANAFLDGLALYRRGRGLPGLSINWGAWNEIGAAAGRDAAERRSKMGIGGISTDDGLKALERLLEERRGQVVVSPMDWAAYFAGTDSESIRPLLSDLRSSRPARSQAASAQKKNALWLPQLECAAPGRRRDLLMRLLEERVQSTLGLGGAQEIDPAQALHELGLDSLLSIELRNSLGACLDRSLPATLLFNYPTLDALAGFILLETGMDAGRDRENKITAEKANSVPANLVDRIESLSDEEVDRLLSARAMEEVQ